MKHAALLYRTIILSYFFVLTPAASPQVVSLRARVGHLALGLDPNRAITEPDKYAGLVVDKSRFPDFVRETLVKEHQQLIGLAEKWKTRCPLTRKWVEKIVNRLLEGSQLPQSNKAEPPLFLDIDCEYTKVSDPRPNAKMRAGVLTINSDAIYITESEDEVAAILAHELAHYTLGHDERVLKTIGKQALSNAQMNPFGGSQFHDIIHPIKQQHEKDADLAGLKILANAGYDPYASLEIQKKTDAAHKAFREKHPDFFLHERVMGTPPPLHEPLGMRLGKLSSEILSKGYQSFGQEKGELAQVKRELENLSK